MQVVGDMETCLAAAFFERARAGTVRRESRSPDPRGSLTFYPPPDVV